MTETPKSGNIPADEPSVRPSPGISHRLGGPPHSAGPPDSAPQPDNAARSNSPSGSDSPGRRTLRPGGGFASARRSAPRRLRRGHLVAATFFGIVLTAFAVKALQQLSKESSPPIAAAPSASDEVRPLAPSSEQSPTPSQSSTPTPAAKAAVAARPSAPTTPPPTTKAPASASPTPSGLPALSPSDPACEKSGSDPTSTSIEFHNERQETIQVYWVSYDGERKHYLHVPPGHSNSLKSPTTHPWVVTTDDGKDVACYVPTVTPTATAVVR